MATPALTLTFDPKAVQVMIALHPDETIDFVEITYQMTAGGHTIGKANRWTPSAAQRLALQALVTAAVLATEGRP